MHRAPESKLGHPLEGHHRRHRRALLIRHALRAASWAAWAVTLAVALGLVFVSGVAGSWARLAALLAVIVVLVLAASRRFLAESVTLEGFLELAEQRFPRLRSWIRNAVDFERAPLDDVSSDLAGAVREEAAQRLEGESIRDLTPRIAPRAPIGRFATAALALVAAGLVWPAATQRSWATLWNPGAAAPPISLSVEPGAVTVTPGATLAVRARVTGTERAPKLDRDEPGARSVTAAAEGRDEHGAKVWRFDLAQLTSAQDYWVQVGGVKSPRYRISLSGEMAPVSFEVEYRPPAYARMPVQRGTSARGDLMALRGSTASLVVTFDRDLERLTATLPGGRSAQWTAITPRRWRGTVPVVQDGAYELHASARAEAEGKTPRDGRFSYRISALPDAPPVLIVQVPEGDVDLPAGQQIPLDILAQDDLGLTELRLEVRKDPEAPWTQRPLARFGGQPREARVASRWDASGLGLLPGQSASFRFVLLDEARGRAVSQTFELRFPSLAEMYEKVDETQSGTQKSLEKAADQAKDLQKSLEKMARQQQRMDQPPSTSFERSEEMRSALERQQEIGQRIEDAAKQLRQSLDQAVEREAFDENLTRKLKQIAELMQQIQSPEFKEALKRMQKALENMDKQQMERNIPDWKARNEEMIKSLERTLELLKKLREEEKLQAMAERAEELKQQQDALNRELEERANGKQESKSEKSDLAERQREAAKESEKLGESAKDAAEKQESKEQKEEIAKAAEELSKDAAEAQEKAAEKSESESSQDSQDAAQQGKSASESLSSAAKRLKSTASSQQEQQEALDLAAVRRAAQDLVSIQRVGEANLSTQQSPIDRSNRQTDLSEGTARVADSLFQLSQESPFLSPKLTQSLGQAINGFMNSGKDMASGNRQRGEDAARGALKSLNQAVRELRQTENAMCASQGGEGKGQKKNAQPSIGQVGNRQSQLNERSRSLAQKLSEQMRLSQGDREQMRRLAEEQARIRSELEEIQKSERAQQELLGRLDEAQKEMKEVEEILERGGGDGELEEKQNRILSRLLDAQRSVNRRDFDPQRESRSGEDVARSSPSELAPELLRQTDRFRQDLLKSELDRYPAQYRSFVEAYLRQLNGSRR